MLTLLADNIDDCAVVLLSLAHSLSAQYDSHYKVQDDEGSEEDEAPTDYTKYFNDGINTGVVRGAVGGAPPPNPDSSGFVQPLDFSGFFAGGHFGGLGSLSDGTNNHPIFRHSGSANAFTGPVGLTSHLETSASNNNNSFGFVNPSVNFRSLFDTSVAGTDVGFRPQDFIQKGETRSSPVVHNQFFTPAFASLKEEVDGGVAKQQREEALAASSKSSGKRHPAEDDYDDESEGGGDYSDDSYEESRLNDRNPQKFTQDKYEDKTHYPSRNGGHHPPYRTPYGQVKKTVNSAPSEPRPARPSRPYPVQPLPTKPETDYGYTSPFDTPSGYDDDDDDLPFNSEPKNAKPIKTVKNNQRNPNKPLNQAHYSGSYNNKKVHVPPHGRNNPGIKTSYAQPASNKPPYRTDQRSRQYPQTTKSPEAYRPYNSPAHTGSRSPNQYDSYGDFRPSPSDPYLDSQPRPGIEPAIGPSHPRSNPIPKSEAIYSLPQTEYASVIPRNTKLQNNDQNLSKKKICTKIQKKLNPEDIESGRFRRQHMTCYVCNEPNTGRKYEECSYESIPNGKAYYKGNSESYSSDTNIRPYTYHTRSKRFATPSYESDFFKDDDFSFGSSSPLTRKVRQYSDYDEGSHYGHDDSNYRFGPEHFTDDGTADDGHSEREEEADSQDNTSGNESCKKVKKDELICMVCKNPKTAGTYEQCSYASDPEENRYSYGTQKTYGSQRPSDTDRYKRRVDEGKEERRKKKKNSIKHKYKHNENLDDLKHRGDFKYGKLKRKKYVKKDYDIPVQFSESVTNRKQVLKESKRKGGLGLDPLFYGSPDPPYNPDVKNEKVKKKKNSEHGRKGLEGAATSNEEDEEEREEQDDSEEDDEDTLSYEDYFLKLFPELAGGKGKYDGSEEETKGDDYFESPEEQEEEEETKQYKKKVDPGFEYHASLPDYFDETENKKDLEKVLGEFTQKDRSDCKKVMRDKMTCYQCIDKKGMQHEECMFVAASEPKSKHLAYHEVKEFRMTPDGKKEEIKKQDTDKLSQTSPVTFESKENIKSIDPASAEIHSVRDQKPTKRSNGKKFKDTTNTSTVHPTATASDNLGQSAEVYDILKLKPKYELKVTTDLNKLNDKLASEIPERVLNRKKRLPENGPNERRAKDSTEEEENDHGQRQERKNYNSVPPEPESFEIPEGPEGAYSHETEPVFDSVLKISLPKYMLQRSEHESIFDEVLASG